MPEMWKNMAWLGSGGYLSECNRDRHPFFDQVIRTFDFLREIRYNL